MALLPVVVEAAAVLLLVPVSEGLLTTVAKPLVDAAGEPGNEDRPEGTDAPPLVAAGSGTPAEVAAVPPGAELAAAPPAAAIAAAWNWANVLSAGALTAKTIPILQWTTGAV